MPKIPSRLITDRYDDERRCDRRLPERALAYRKEHNLLSPADLASYNVTVWWVKNGSLESWIIERNTRIVDLRNPNAPLPMTEVGFHSEMLAYESLKALPGFATGQAKVQEIFTERAPCLEMCKPMLATYMKGVPVYYYIPHRVNWWNIPTAEMLRVVYEL